MQIPIHLVKPEWEIGKRICKIGFSPFLILATDSVIIIALNAVLQYYGGESQGDTLITAATIVQSYMLLITSPMLGITGGSQPLISFNYGANKPDRIRKTVKWVLVLCITFTTVMFLVSRILPQYFVQIFYRQCKIPGTVHMGNPGVYIDGDPTQPPVCVCGCADGAWDDKAFP